MNGDRGNLTAWLQAPDFHRLAYRSTPLNKWDGLFWIGLSRVWKGWRGALVFVQPDAVRDGSATGFGASGLGCREWTAAAPEGRPWLKKCDDSFCRWQRPIRCGGRQGFTGNSKCSTPWFRRAPFPVCCGPYRPSVGVSLSGLRIAMYTDNGCFLLLSRFDGLWRRRNGTVASMDLIG